MSVVQLQDFTPVAGLVGGALIGLSASILLLAHGQIAGISGIVGNVVERGPGLAWRVAFLAGLSLGGIGVALAFPAALSMAGSPSLPLLAVGGLLVGFGSRLGAGCTSGHGVCGLSRRSPRSLVSVVLFMATGFATAMLVHGATR